MKKKSIFMICGLAAILVGLAACSGDQSQPTDPLEGTSWQLLFYRKSTVLEGTEPPSRSKMEKLAAVPDVTLTLVLTG